MQARRQTDRRAGKLRKKASFSKDAHGVVQKRASFSKDAHEGPKMLMVWRFLRMHFVV
jgi:hypothetical protein